MILYYESSVLADRGRNAEAEQALDRLLARQPNEAGYLLKFQWLFGRGDFEAMRRVLPEMPPTLLRNDNIASWAAAIWLGSRDTKQARAALEASPGDYFNTRFFNGPKAIYEALTYEMEGSREAARAKWEVALLVINKRLADDPNETRLLSLKARIMARLDRKPEAEEVARIWRQLVGSKEPTEFNVYFSAAMGRNDEAIAQLEAWERAGRLSSGLRIYLRFDPHFDALRGNPRFDALLVEPEAKQVQKPEVGEQKPSAPAPKK